MSTEFLFYGCWNRIDCESKDTLYRYRDVVLDYIFVSESRIKDFYIAGDNWYPNMISKGTQPFEYYFTSILKSGYDKIYGLGKNIYIVLGNHDEISMKKTEPLLHRCMLNTQRYYLDNIGDISVLTPSLELLDEQYNKQKMPELRRHNSLSLPKTPQETLTRQKSLPTVQISGSKIILYTDINSIKKQKYIMIFINTNKIHDKNYLTKLEKHIKICEKVHKPIFVMGHLPIIYFRYKEAKVKGEKAKGEKKPYFRQMKTEGTEDKKSDDKKNLDIKRLYDILADNNCIYLCADTHSFEIMNIQDRTNGTKTLVQIVAGTGGGMPDEVQSDNSYFDNSNQDSYDNDFVSSFGIEGTCVNSYGYSKIQVIDTSQIKVHYIQVIHHNNKTFTELKPIQFTYYITKNVDGKWVYNKPENNLRLLGTKVIDPNSYKRDELCKLNINDVVYNLNRAMPCFEKPNK